MEKYPRLKKLFDWPAVVGALIGAGIVIFLVYPPAPGWGSNEKWGDVGGWLGAIATFSAAAAALWLAGREARERRQQRAAEAQVLASLLEIEIKDVADKARGLSAVMAFRTNNDDWRADVAARSIDIQLPMTAARVERLPVFPPNLASDLASALALAERVRRVAQQISSADWLERWWGRDAERIEQLDTDVSNLADFLAISVEACKVLAYDGRMTPWHPDFGATGHEDTGDPL